MNRRTSAALRLLQRPHELPKAQPAKALADAVLLDGSLIIPGPIVLQEDFDLRLLNRRRMQMEAAANGSPPVRH